MNLPEIGPLLTNQSTYITATGALLDLDKANQNSTPFFFSRMVAMQLPQYAVPNFFLDLTSQGVISTSPNTILPKGIQYYTENISRNFLSSYSKRGTELAFWKLLNKCGMSYADIQASIKFVNKVATSNFITIENNGGWGEIVGVIPNQCSILTTAWANNPNVPDIVTSDPQNDSDGLFDTGDKEFTFTDPLSKQTLDFDNCTFDTDTPNESFDFNLLLFFYQDADGIDKLHGVNFIAPYVNMVSYWQLPISTQFNNQATSVGYQYKLNLKTCNNAASLVLVQDYNGDGSQWNLYFESLSNFNSFLELQKRGNTPVG
jgi:hypothetical protein